MNTSTSLRRAILCSAAAAAAVSFPAGALATVDFSFRALDASGFITLQVRDVANGYAVGYGVMPGSGGSSDQHAFAWPLDGGGRIDLSHGYQSEALGVDNQNRIAGDVRFATVMQANPGFWSGPGAAPEDYSGNLWYGVAQASQGNKLVGWGRRLVAPNPVNDSGFVWDIPTRTRTSLPAPGGGGGATYANDIDGEIVVGNAYLAAGGNPSAAAWDVSDLSDPVAIDLHPAGFDYSATSAIRGRQVVGLARSGPAGESHNHAYLWNLEAGRAYDLHALLPASLGAIASSASDVIGPIVVGSIWRGGDDLAPIIWNTSNGEVLDLRQFLPAGVTFATGAAVNDNGQIAGDFRYADGARGAFILTPDTFPGDATLDGTVDLDDFSILAGHFGRSNADWGVADFNGDNVTDIADFALMAGHFGKTAAAASRPGAVPEAGAGVVAVALAAHLAGRRRRTR